MGDVASALRKASIEIENAVLVLLEYSNDDDVRPITRRSILAAVTRGNDIASRLAQLAEWEAGR